MDINIIYKIITDAWKFAKKYLANIDKNTSDEYWSKMVEESNAIYVSTEGQPDYVRQFHKDIMKAVIALLEEIYRKERKE